MKSEAVLLVGPRSNRKLTYGMSIAFDLLIEGMAERNIQHFVVDRSLGMAERKVGVFSMGGILATLKMLVHFLQKLTRVNYVYIAIGNSMAGFLRDMLMIWPSWLLKRRIVLHLHGGGFRDFYESRSPLLRKMISATFAKADVIIVLGDLLRDQFQFIPDIDSKLRVVPNGLPNELPISTYTKNKQLKAKSIKLLYLSNMIPSKGYLDVLEACRILHKKGLSLECNFCGAFITTINDNAETSAENAQDAFYRLIREKGLEDVVRYHGTVRGERKKEILEEADIFVLPTLYPWEGQPISIIEALAYGLPVITTRYRGIPEQVINGHNGFLLEQKSGTEIAIAVEKLWKNPTQYKEFSKNAITHYQQYFTREAHLNRLIPVILGHGV